MVLVVVDTLRADRLGCHGYAEYTSPHIDALAARGTRYAEARAQGSWTVPSMISLMTGLYVTDTEERLPDYAATLAERARSAGRDTAAFIANEVLSTERGFDRGFDHYELLPKARAGVVVDAFRRWYAGQRTRLGEGDGFLVWLHPSDPHTPYEPEPWHLRPPGGTRPGDRCFYPLEQLQRQPPADAEELASARRFVLEQSRRYDGEVRAVDEALGELLAFLQEEGELERTLVILASDHGEELFEHARYPEEVQSLRQRLPEGASLPLVDLLARRHGEHSDVVLHTPLILAGPGIPAGQVHAGLAANLDLLPTILQALGLPVPARIAGTSLLDDPLPDRQQLFSFGYRAAAVVERSGLKLIDRRALVEHSRRNPWMAAFAGDARALELFDRQADPSERHNAAPERALDVRRLQDALEAWRAQHGRERDTHVSGADRQALLEMGYLGDGR